MAIHSGVVGALVVAFAVAAGPAIAADQGRPPSRIISEGRVVDDGAAETAPAKEQPASRHAKERPAGENAETPPPANRAEKSASNYKRAVPPELLARQMEARRRAAAPPAVMSPAPSAPAGTTSNPPRDTPVQNPGYPVFLYGH